MSNKNVKFNTGYKTLTLGTQKFKENNSYTNNTLSANALNNKTAEAIIASLPGLITWLDATILNPAGVSGNSVLSVYSRVTGATCSIASSLDSLRLGSSLGHLSSTGLQVLSSSLPATPLVYGINTGSIYTAASPEFYLTYKGDVGNQLRFLQSDAEDFVQINSQAVAGFYYSLTGTIGGVGINIPIANTAAPFGPNTTHTYVMQQSALGLNIYFDSVLIGSFNKLAGTSSANYLGTLLVSGLTMLGFEELFISKLSPTASEITKIASYMNNKWGQTIT
jgi:hypothetical protein